MIVSLNWLKKFTDIDMPVDELATLIGARLVEIESVVDLGAKYDKATIVKVVQAEKLDDSDHLNIVKIDDNGATAGVERIEDNLIQVVCGAPNIAAGQLVVWLPPESIVPETFGKPEPFKLGVRNLQGVTSNGMIASAKELDLYDDHSGILVLDGDDTLVGASFAKTFELDDYLLDIENKSLTHRPDCFGIIGFAREVAAIAGKQFKTPDWLMNLQPDFNSTGEISLKVSIDDPKLSDRYLAIVVAGADSKKQSPLLIQTYLARVGVRPINAVVDVTNYLMMLTGQPLHAFDFDKLVAVGGGNADIHVRTGREAEQLELLDGRTIKLATDDIVIAAGETAIGLAGAMGGANTAIDGNTKNIIIEAATFNLFNLRSTQMRHGIFSEAITRFTKGQPAGLSAPVLGNAVDLMNEWAGASCVSQLAGAYPGKHEPIQIDIVTEQINSVLGGEFTNDQIIGSLNNAEFIVKSTESGKISITVPYWRNDIKINEDIIEEVGRLNGFDNINSTLPTRDFVAVKPSDFDTFKTKIRKLLVRAGANEVLTYSFVHGDLMKKAALDVKNCYKIVNSISPSLQYYRQSLIPSLLDLIHPNIKQGFDQFAIFEMNKTHPRSCGLTDENVPIELDMLGMVITNKNPNSDTAYYQVKRVLDYITETVGLKLNYELINDESDPIYVAFEPKRSATVVDSGTGKVLGVIGEYKTSVIKLFKLPIKSAGLEINMKDLFESAAKLGVNYKPLSRFPSTERDLCFKVQKDTAYSKLTDAINKSSEPDGLDLLVTPIDIYQPEMGDTKNITIRIRLTASDHTLTGDETNEVVGRLVSAVTAATGAEVV